MSEEDYPYRYEITIPKNKRKEIALIKDAITITNQDFSKFVVDAILDRYERME